MVMILSPIAFILFCTFLISGIKLVKIIKKAKLNGEKNYLIKQKRIYFLLVIFSFTVFLIIFIILIFLNLAKGG